jgi:imidazole glycerol-phosphate synthase subunit HisH
LITVVDYGLGNIQAFVDIYKRLNIPVSVAQTADALETADRVILPGVGAFDWAMARLNESGMREMLDNLVVVKRRPVLGVCVGMQMMADRSDEGALPGLGWVPGEVKRFEHDRFTTKTHLPHMGWNDVTPKTEGRLFRNVEAPVFYFLHSYYFSARNPNSVIATTDYGGEFVSAVNIDNVFGTQFHPEKSHSWGVNLLRNFAEHTPC